MKGHLSPRAEELLVERALRPLDDKELKELDQLHAANDESFDLAAAAVAISATVAGGQLGWTLPLAVAAGLAAAFAVQRHAVRRLGGITGDVLGALAEIATTVTLVVAAMGPPA